MGLLGPPRQQHQDHVAAGGQEEDARDHGEDSQEPRGLAVMVGAETEVIDGPGDEAPVLGPHLGRFGGNPVPGQGRERLGGAERRRRRQPSDRVQPDPVGTEHVGTLGRELLDRRQRHPEVRVVGRAGKRVGGDADDCERLRSEADGAPDEIRVAAEARRPGAMGHDDDRRRAARVVVRRRQQAAEPRRRPQQGEEVAGHQRDVHPRWGAPGGDHGEVQDPERRQGECLRPHLAQPQVLGMGQRREVIVLDPDVEREKPVRRGQVERPPEVPIQRGQHHRRDAEREGERQHGSHRERAAAAQRSERAVEVTSHGQSRDWRRPPLGAAARRQAILR